MSENHPPKRPRLPSPLDAPAAECDPPAKETGPSSLSPNARPHRFSIRFLMLLTLVVAIATAGYSGMNQGGGRRIGALFFTLVSPILLLIVLSGVQWWLRRRR